MTTRTRFSGTAVRQRRHARGLTQTQLAEMVGRQITTVSHWELGRKQPRGHVLPDLARALHCNIEDLFEVAR